MRLIYIHPIYLLPRFVLTLSILFQGVHLTGQSSSDTIISLQPIVLHSLKINAIDQEFPQAVTKIQLFENQNLTSQVSLGEYIGEIPGIFSLNRNNFAQDIRISIRGFGSRAAFGIRGIKLVVDGIPETTPDGQGQVDNIPLGLLKSIEVLRGPSASIYGNAAGGVMYLTTIDSLINQRASIRYTHGANKLNALQAIVGIKNDKTSAILYQSLTNSDGYRNHSHFKQRVFNAKFAHQFSKKSIVQGQINFTDSPIAEDAGGLTLSEFQQNRKQARSRNTQFDAHEIIQHMKLGSSWRYQFHKDWTFINSGYLSRRDFYGQLPFVNGGIVSLDRFYYGLNSRLSYQKQHVEMQLGVEYNHQDDVRQRFENLDGLQGKKTFNQTESFTSASFFGTGLLKYNDFTIHGGLGYNRQTIGASSIETTNLFQSLNPNIGVGLSLGKSLLFAHLSSSFETPTLSEFSANRLREGLNFDLKANKAWNYEIGWKMQRSLTQLELVLFHINTSNEIIPYEDASFPNRVFYRNSGETVRTGIELFYRQGFKHLVGRVAYSYSNIIFRDYFLNGSDLSGNRLPGLPMQQLNFQLQSHDLGPWTLKLKGSLVGKLYADDANEVEIDSYQVYDLSGNRTLRAFNSQLNIALGIQNLFQEHYNDNVRINAFGKRFYEPAPLRTYYIGINLEI
ncbi:MAG: TonB-dependent receptor [Flavobacteriaceae bacterium]|nr:TonB-dependent receptor [Flavobacteriaceae bacterium]